MYSPIYNPPSLLSDVPLPLSFPFFQSPLEAAPDGSGFRSAPFPARMMQLHLDWTVFNRGVNGERSDQIAARFDRDVLTANPQFVVIIAGVNDVYQGRSAELAALMRRSLERYLPAG